MNQWEELCDGLVGVVELGRLYGLWERGLLGEVYGDLEVRVGASVKNGLCCKHRFRASAKNAFSIS